MGAEKSIQTDKKRCTWNPRHLYINEEYKSVESTVDCIKVFNDIAEHVVALMDEYNKLLTNNEEQKHFLLLILKEYRRGYPDILFALGSRRLGKIDV